MDHLAVAVPKILLTKLSGDKPLCGYVSESLAIFTPWLKDSGTPFFRGYTDHGLDHLQRVLNTADWLIPREAQAILSARDVACIVLAVLLHDIAMHLTEDNFRSLVTNRSLTPLIPELDHVPWWRLWEDYMLEARGWTRTMQENVLGAEWRARALTDLNVYKPSGFADLSESDRLFIGEFVRRHHPRLAHEVAVRGVPGPRDPLQLPISSSCPQLADVAGLVARSHGMNIRNTFVYLNRRHDGFRYVYGIVPVYLMGVLRIADYLDLHAERAPKSLLKVKALRSSISQQEWDAHQAITDIRYGGSIDPEQVEIIANPTSPRNYASIVRWVRGIQSELDHTWAVLGEVFGADSRFRHLKLRIRRITSPLENEKQFSDDKQLSFVPQPAKFVASSAELIPLLAKPLYGDHPEIGIRELLQNAVDSVNEMQNLLARNLISSEIEAARHQISDLRADVRISVCERTLDTVVADDIPEDWKYWVEVIDRGQGMTPDIIRNYFLTVGSTLRRNASWLHLFANSNRTDIIRSGRFGVGTIAAFALGDRIQVVTRHYSEDSFGTSFTAGLDDEVIELHRKLVPIGTTIRVKTTQDTFERLSKAPEKWDWFCLDQPKIRRLLWAGQRITELRPQLIISLADPTVGGWKRVSGSNLQMCYSRCDSASYRHLLYCNGIRIRSWHRNFDKNYFSSVPELKQPTVLIIDSDAQLPLTIARDDLTGKPSYINLVQREMLITHCMWLLEQASLPASQREPYKAPTWELEHSMHPGDGTITSAAYIVTATGLVPMTEWHIKNAQLSSIAVYFSSENLRTVSKSNAPSVTLRPLDIMADDHLSGPRIALDVHPYGGFGWEPFGQIVLRELRSFLNKELGNHSGCIVLPSEILADLKNADGSIIPAYKNGGKIDSDSVSGWSCLSYGLNAPESSEAFALLNQPSCLLRSCDAGARGIALCKLDYSTHAKHDDFSDIWQELSLPPVIPFDNILRHENCGEGVNAISACFR